MRMRGQASTEYLVAAVFCFFLLFGRIGDQPSSVADQLLTALKKFRAEEKLAASLSLFASRLPVWDAERELLTLDYPPGRASVASVQNFQLAALLPRSTYRDGDEEDEEVCSQTCFC